MAQQWTTLHNLSLSANILTTLTVVSPKGIERLGGDDGGKMGGKFGRFPSNCHFFVGYQGRSRTAPPMSLEKFPHTAGSTQHSVPVLTVERCILCDELAWRRRWDGDVRTKGATRSFTQGAREPSNVLLPAPKSWPATEGRAPLDITVLSYRDRSV